MVLATALEIFASLVWGEYRYRLGNVPLFVPFGHGLVCVFGVRGARTPLALRHRRALLTVTAVLAATWAVAGLSIFPWVLHWRKDSGGGLLFPIFLLFLLRSPRAPIFAGIFYATSVLELVGTGLGNWAWAVHAPFLQFGAGNPPSVIAGAYCVLDGAALVTAGWIESGLLRAHGWAPRGGRSTVEAA
ncbi:MAG: hypothetical protein ACYDGR_00720 [Candidatus Dormibacteria bacterium]